jgi:hypothetical protein
MDGSALRRLASYVLLVVFPMSLFAADTKAAMLYTSGAAWINGTHVPRSSAAIFSGDLLQTRSDSVANINEPGSIVTVLPDSLVRFETASLSLEHGGVTIATSEGVTASAGDVRVAPASHAWTEFNVTDVNGTVHIAARKGDVTIDDGAGQTVTLAQGQETTRDESSNPDNSSKKKKNRKGVPAGATPAAEGGILNSPIAVGVGAAAVGGIAIWVLIKSDNPASPAVP